MYFVFIFSEYTTIHNRTQKYLADLANSYFENPNFFQNDMLKKW